MRGQKFSLIALSTVIVISSSLIVTSTTVLVKTARADNKQKTCTSNSNSACATCESTKNVYQCKPADLPTNCIYGTCPLTAQGPCGDCLGQNCGNTDWNCETPSQSIDNSTACDNQRCETCKNA
jgi:hypothetical protein